MTDNTKYSMTLDEESGLYRIKALRDIADVPAGTVGGLIESENNLSTDGDSWIGREARATGMARVQDSARMWNTSRLSGCALMEGNSRIRGRAAASGNARIAGSAVVDGGAEISGDAWIAGNARISGLARISGGATIYGTARIRGDAAITDRGHVFWIGCPWAWDVTVYRTTQGHEITAGCQNFTVDRLREVAENEEFDDGLGWDMLPGLAAMIKVFVASLQH